MSSHHLKFQLWSSHYNRKYGVYWWIFLEGGPSALLVTWIMYFLLAGTQQQKPAQHLLHTVTEPLCHCGVHPWHQHRYVSGQCVHKHLDTNTHNLWATWRTAGTRPDRGEEATWQTKTFITICDNPEERTTPWNSAFILILRKLLWQLWLLKQ